MDEIKKCPEKLVVPPRKFACNKALSQLLNVPCWVTEGHDIALVAGNGNKEVSTLSITFLLTIVVAFPFAMHRAMAETNRQAQVRITASRVSARIKCFAPMLHPNFLRQANCHEVGTRASADSEFVGHVFLFFPSRSCFA